MPITIESRAEQFASDLDFLLHFQNVLLRAVEGSRDEEIDKEYRQLRDALMAEPRYADLIPQFVAHHRDLGSLWPTFKSFSPQWEPRRVEVRRQFEPAIAEADRVDPFGQAWHGDPPFDSTTWTGAEGPLARIAAVKTLLPVARASVERLIESLEAPGHNGGPPLDGTDEAVEALRTLHRLLGEIIQAADEGRLAQAYHGDLVAEAARYAKRAAKQLRDDPMPYAVSALILSVLSACGFPGIGGFLGGVAANIRRSS